MSDISALILTSPGKGQVVGSRFDGRPTPNLHARRVPADIDCSVMIGVNSETTVPAGKRRLALSALAVDGSTFRTCLGTVCGRHLHQGAGPLFKLIGKDGLKSSPALIEDGAIETAFARASGGHSPDIQG